MRWVCGIKDKKLRLRMEEKMNCKCTEGIEEGTGNKIALKRLHVQRREREREAERERERQRGRERDGARESEREIE